MPRGTSNLHTLEVRGVSLCVHCPKCGRRALMAAEVLEKHMHHMRYPGGTMTPLSSLHFKCKRCGCRAIDRWLPLFKDMAERFMRYGAVDGMEYQGPQKGDVTRIVLT